ncbi:hypothetical protein F4054_21960 [Candidatus Poribacteria bacterium]|nr:hypothetical protein [Candidatus Poribacteria bacterium]MYK24915.1 hypothetical protein [Candidatus Poribacteria bacterium]
MNPMDLPLNWRIVRFGEVATFTKKPKGLRYSEYDEVSFVRMNLIPIAKLYSKAFNLKSTDELSSGTYFEPGDILLAKITPSFENGKQCIIRELPTPFGIATTEVIPIREVEGVSDKIYLFYYLLVPDVRALLTGKMKGTTGRLRLGAEALADLETPLPPLAEQHRIVAKLEVLFTQLDAAVDNLKEAQAQLQRYRQSILKAAFEGELTKEWREADREVVQLRDIVNLRRETVQPDDGNKELNFVGLKYIDSGVSILKRWGDASEVKSAKARFYPNDVLYGRLNPHLDKAVIAEIEGICSTDILVFTANSKMIPRFLVYLLHSYPFRSHAMATASGITLPRTSWNALGEFTFTLPSLTEQEQIVSELERHLSVADQIEATLDAELKSAERLRQSILKHAFSGKLVPQDPNDEPVNVLLEKIQEEKGHQQPKRKKTTKIASPTKQLSLPFN